MHGGYCDLLTDLLPPGISITDRWVQDAGREAGGDVEGRRVRGNGQDEGR